MKDIWDKLPRNQRIALLAGVAVLVLGLVVQLVAFPLYDARKRTTRSIAVSEKALQQLGPLWVEYRVLKEGAQAVQQIVARRPGDFTLFSYLEKKTGEAGVKPNVKYINPSRGSVTGGYEETSVDLKLEKITLKQLVNFLYMVESREDLIALRKIAVAKVKEDPDYLNATIQVTTIQIPKGGLAAPGALRR
jgi:general secretion pathway protein M